MGRYINASIIGRDSEDQIVHKFWFAIQASDVSDYLETYAVAGQPEEWVFALLHTDHQVAIKRTITILQHELTRRFGWTYKRVMAAEAVGQWSAIEAVRRDHDLLELASRINLGEHLLETIKQMRRQGITEQELLIELL